jgi:hypothetical protein
MPAAHLRSTTALAYIWTHSLNSHVGWGTEPHVLVGMAVRVQILGNPWFLHLTGASSVVFLQL